MKTLSFISIVGSEAQIPEHQQHITQSTKTLNWKVLKMHGRHMASWLLLGAGISYLFHLGTQVVEGKAGEAISWTAGFLLVFLLLYIWKGHQGVQRFRKAKIYWLQSDAAGKEMPYTPTERRATI
jgi:hypothetical protein